LINKKYISFNIDGNCPGISTNVDYFRPERPEPTRSPISRTASPAKSVKSIHWMLRSSKHPLFDNKVRNFSLHKK